MLTGTLSCLINDTKVKQDRGYIFNLIISIGRIIGFSRTLNEPSFFGLGDFEGFVFDIFFIYLNNLYASGCSGVEAFKKGLSHFATLSTGVTSFRSGVKGKAHACSIRYNKKYCFVVFVHSNKNKNLDLN